MNGCVNNYYYLLYVKGSILERRYVFASEMETRGMADLISSLVHLVRNFENFSKSKSKLGS